MKRSMERSMSKSLLVREMTLSDVEGVHEVEVASFKAPWSLDAFRAECENDHATYLVLVLDEKIIGFGGIWHVLSEGHITNIAIHPEYRGRGLGKILIEEMIVWAKAVGILDMTLEVRKSNSVAIGLYEKHGFVSHGIRPKYYQDNGEDALIMWLKIQAEE